MRSTEAHVAREIRPPVRSERWLWFRQAGGRVARLVPGATVVDLPDHDKHILEKATALVAKQVSGFLG